MRLRSRNDNDFSARYPAIVTALAALPDETVVDGEVVAVDGDGKPSFNALQNYDSSRSPLLFYIFDLLVLSGREVVAEPLIAGFTPSDENLDALIIGYYEKGKLPYAGRTRNGFTLAIRVELTKRLRPLQVAECPSTIFRKRKADGGARD